MDNMDENLNNDEDKWEYLPEESKEAYRNSPVWRIPFEDQIGYWRDRAKYFESEAFYLKHILEQRGEQDNDADWWRRDSDDE